MAAYAALASVMNIIHDIQHHHSPPVSIHKQQLQSLTQILTSLHQFLDAYKSSVADGDEADPLEMRIADAAYAVEDVIESHIVDNIHLTTSAATHHQQTSLVASKTSCFFNCYRAPRNVNKDLQRAIRKMELINKEAMKIDTEKAGVVNNHGVSASAVSVRSSSSSAMVCSNDVLLGLMEKLIGGRLDRQVIPIVGMGGIGKTTLASNIYARQLIKEHFDVCAWVTISQQYSISVILGEVLSQATNRNKEELSERCEDELGSELYKYLFGRRFLIVMDDMWSIDSWEKIQHFFPNNGNGSRILVTTRLSQLSSQLNTNYRLQMEFLDEVSSWDLFSKTVFGERSCPPELMNIGKKIVGNCRGLPLSIVVVGGILKKMEHTQGCWESIRNNLTSVLNLENDKHCLRLLKLSYNHLPAYLKPCFLYMGVFEEDDEISVSTLFKLWVSEGFLKPMNDRSLETIAMGFLKDLVDRNLILIDKLGSTGNIKSCKVHDLLRDLCLNEGQKEGFHHVIGQCRPQGINRQCRRVVIRRNTSKKKVLKELKSMPHVRSVICEYGKLPPFLNLGLLRTLHAYKRRGFDDQSYENPLMLQYVNLRHLAFEVRDMHSFFSSFNLLWNLHTIIVSCSYIYKATAPAEFWKMPQLCHIEFTTCPLSLLDPPCSRDQANVVVMENLRILKGVKNFNCSQEVIKRIPNIKKLKIGYYGTQPNCYYYFSNISSLCKLESLSVSSSRNFLGGPLLHALSFPHSLKSLCLAMKSKFEWEDVLEKMGSLPLLEKLQLWFGCFGTGKWEIVEGQFLNLKCLGLFMCPGLKQWTVEESSSSLPRLEQLRVVALEELEEIPSEIGNIATLQKIWLAACSESAVISVKNMVEEQVELQGEQLPFHAEVWVLGKNQALERFSTPNFKVLEHPQEFSQSMPKIFTIVDEYVD